MSESARTTGGTPQPGSPQQRQLLILTVASGVILIVVAVLITVFLGLKGTWQPAEGTETPTPRVATASTTQASPLPTPSCQAVISSGEVEVSLALPVSLTVGDMTFPVEP
ncbi:MAG: hypothetical protein PVF54_04745, partial [Anaerolineae bacterium]